MKDVTGKSIEKIESRIEKINSIPEIKGLPSPPWKTEDIDLALTDRNWKSAAIKPPIINDNINLKKGSIPVITENERIVPAIIENGVVIVSSMLSTQGLKYPATSIKVAKANNITACIDDNHTKLLSIFSKPILTAIPSIKKGINILKPLAALNPIPINMLIKFSNII